MTRRGIVRATLAAATVAAILAPVPAVAVEPLTQRTVTPWPAGYPACAFEDSPGPCYWDAPDRGNGLGHSFYVTPGHRLVRLALPGDVMPSLSA